MNDFGGPIPVGGPSKSKFSRFRLWVLLAVPLAAILFQVYVPLFVEFLAYLHLPMLVTVYFAVMGRSPLAGIFIGAGIGLVQDSLSHHPIGMFGIVKTLVGYTAASLGLRFDVQHALIRFGLGFFFVLFHEFFYWLLRRALLGQMVEPDVPWTLLIGLLNALFSVPLFAVLDKLMEEG